jgi:cell division protease FtsH
MRNLLNYGKEIAIGIVPVALIFLLYIGFPVSVLVMGAFMATAIYMFTRQRGGGGLALGAAGKKASARKPQFMTFEDIGGQEQPKRELKEALEFLVQRDQIEKLGIRPMKGILLTGPPGTGKTLLAKAAAQHTCSAFVAASGSEFVEMYVGVGAGRIRDLFKEARQQAAKLKLNSAIIFIDEIDGIGGKRDGGQHREYDQTLNQLLTEMDGVQGDESVRVLLIAATNRKELLDPALLRPGRFDRHIQVDLPDKTGREHILGIHARNKPLDETVSLSKIAEETFGFSGAQLESVMNEGAIYAMRDQASTIGMTHLSQAIDKVMMGERMDRETNSEERERVAIHELGHAIVAESVRPGSVAQVSLTPRGQALGYVRHHPQQDRYLYTKRVLEEQIMIALGGAVAEELHYGGRSTGSRGDFEQATGIVRTLIESGMSDLGIIHPQALTQEMWSKENGAILEALTERTRELLGAHMETFKHLLAHLIQEETLSGEQLRSRMQQYAA